jgi:hypothetical protein
MVRKLAQSAAVLWRAIRTPSDLALTIRIGVFIIRIPHELARTDLSTFLARLRNAPRPKAHNLTVGAERIKRLRGACLAMPALWRRDSCYVRALTLYRFLDPGTRKVEVHFGVELPDPRMRRLHGHAWVTADREILEGPDAVFAGRIREISSRG